MIDCTYPVIISLLIGFIGGFAVCTLLTPYCCRLQPETEE